MLLQILLSELIQNPKINQINGRKQNDQSILMIYGW